MAAKSRSQKRSASRARTRRRTAKARRKPAGRRRPARRAHAARPGRRPSARRAPKQARQSATRTRRAGRIRSAGSARTKTRAPKAAARGARPPRPAPEAARAGRPRPGELPALRRERRLLADDERLDLTAGVAHALDTSDRMLSAARTGHDELRQELDRHTEGGPELTAGDVDARWQDAYAIGDEAPGGDNPTPDQDRVDDIGRALGIEYEDDQELRGGEEVADRDRHRWELDPASSDDWPHER